VIDNGDSDTCSGLQGAQLFQFLHLFEGGAESRDDIRRDRRAAGTARARLP
jgi:hypothetical protein